jgi:hypothetical protein
MSTDEIKTRFVNEIKLRAYDDTYIDRNEEREILQIAIQLGVGIDSARVALVQVCEELGYIIETALLRQIKARIEAAVGAEVRVDRAAFDRIVQHIKGQVEGKKTDREVMKLVVAVMEELGTTRVKTGWFRNWYTSLKQDLGM